MSLKRVWMRLVGEGSMFANANRQLVEQCCLTERVAHGTISFSDQQAE